MVIILSNLDGCTARCLNVCDDDVYLEYYSGKGFHMNYSCLHVLRRTHKLVQYGISNEYKKWIYVQ
jgi:hypothetical protein